LDSRVVRARELKQAEPATEMQTCTQQEARGQVQGWCYVDARLGGNPELVASCPADRKRLVRFLGDNVPAAGSLTFLQCHGGRLRL
jgi:hypothetical protein